jgi:hypothetical protein
MTRSKTMTKYVYCNHKGTRGESLLTELPKDTSGTDYDGETIAAIPAGAGYCSSCGWCPGYGRVDVTTLEPLNLRAAILTAAEELRSGERSHTDVANWLLDLDKRLRDGSASP